jgi:hypothetical protein
VTSSPATSVQDPRGPSFRRLANAAEVLVALDHAMDALPASDARAFAHLVTTMDDALTRLQSALNDYRQVEAQS